MGHMTINTITTTYDIKKVLPWWLLMLSVLLILIISILFCPNIHPDDQDTQTKYLFSWYNFIKYSRVYNSYQICLSKIRLGIILILFKCQNSCKQQFKHFWAYSPITDGYILCSQFSMHRQLLFSFYQFNRIPGVHMMQ